MEAYPAKRDSSPDVFKWGLGPKDLKTVHVLLFGKNFAGAVALQETARLLMAAVGFPFRMKDDTKKGWDTDDGQMFACGTEARWRVDHLYEKIGDKIRGASTTSKAKSK